MADNEANSEGRGLQRTLLRWQAQNEMGRKTTKDLRILSSQPRPSNGRTLLWTKNSDACDVLM